MHQLLPGRIESIYIAVASCALLESREKIEALAQRGLQGDRYCLKTGYYSNINGWGAQVTLIESEAIAAINAGHRTAYTAAMLRRNLVTEGIKLKQLLGQEFRCGGAVLRGIKEYPPCMHLAELIGDKKILQYLAYCGGIGAEVVSGGTICTGDEIDVLC